MCDRETWRAVAPPFSDYEVSDKGQVRIAATGKLLKQFQQK